MAIKIRQSGQWVEVSSSGGSGGGGISDAPNDGKQYGRQSQSWTEITGGGGGSEFVLLSEQSATGTSVEFTGIPSDAKEITLMLLRVSPSGLDDLKVQLGTSSSYITSGYYSASENSQGTVNPDSTDSFIIMNDVGDTSSYSGLMAINKSSNTSYVQTGGFYRADDAGCDTFGDLQSVSGTVDRLRIILSGSNTFDAGKFGLSYKTDGSGGGVGIGSTSKIVQGNTEAEVVDTGSDGHFKVLTEGTERFRIGPTGVATFTADINASGGNSGQINIDPDTSTSNGRIRYSGTKTFMIEGGSSFDNKIEIHGHQNSLNILCEGQGETELYFNGNKKLATTGAGITVTGISSATEGFDFGVNSSGTPVTTGSVKTLNFSGTNNTITYDASTKTVDIDIDSGSGGGGISDAPNDGKQYGRQSQSWTEITGGGGGTVFSGTFTASAGSPSTLNTYAYDSAELVFEYTVFVKNGSDYQSQKLLVMRDGTTVHSTQYGVMYSNNPLVELDATISGSNLLLRATPETGVNGSTTYRLKRESV